MDGRSSEQRGKLIELRQQRATRAGNDGRRLSGRGMQATASIAAPAAPQLGWRVTSDRLILLIELFVIGDIALLVRWIGATRQSLWLDEAYSVFLASHRLPQILSFTASSDAHPPLYYILLHTWMTLLGPSELAVRGLSLLASAGAAMMTYLVGRAVASHRAALLAGAMMSFSSFQVWYAQEARMYALTTLATLVALYGLTCALRTSLPRHWTMYAVGMLAALYLDYSAGYVLMGIMFWFALIGRHEEQVSLPFILSTLAALVGYTPWLPLFSQQIRSVSGLTAWIGGAPGTGIVNVLTDFFFNRSNLSQPATTPDGIVAIALSLAAVAYALWEPRRHPAYPLLALWVSCPLLLGLMSEFYDHPITIARTMMVVQPELLLLLALAVDVQISRHVAFHTERDGLLLTGLLLAALLVGNIGAQVSADTTTIKEDWRGAAAAVSTQQQPGDLILFDAYYSQMPFDYYYYQQAPSVESVVVERGYQIQESLLYADFSQSGSGVNSPREIESYGRVWVVLSHAAPPSGQLTALLKHFHLVSDQRLVGVTLLLYVKTA